MAPRRRKRGGKKRRKNQTQFSFRIKSAARTAGKWWLPLPASACSWHGVWAEHWPLCQHRSARGGRHLISVSGVCGDVLVNWCHNRHLLQLVPWHGGFRLVQEMAAQPMGRGISAGTIPLWAAKWGGKPLGSGKLQLSLPARPIVWWLVLPFVSEGVTCGSQSPVHSHPVLLGVGLLPSPCPPFPPSSIWPMHGENSVEEGHS